MNDCHIQQWVNSRSLISKTDLDEIYKNVDMTTEKLIRPKEVINHTFSYERHIQIPEKIKEFYSYIGRPTPLRRAFMLEKYLGNNNKIYIKREDLLPNGSFKINLIAPQVYFGAEEGRTLAIAETSAGHVGVATAVASNYFGINCLILMTDKSYIQKPYRRYMMELYNAKVWSSPSKFTDIGRSMYNGKLQGSIAKATSEVLELVKKDRKSFKISGSLTDQTLTYNSVVGSEAMLQLKRDTGKALPDVVMCCVGGGASFGGLTVPLLAEDDGNMEVIAVESSVIPTLTKGEYRYEFKDSNKQLASIKMYSLGTEYKIPEMYATGLTYHAASPIISYFVGNRRITPYAVTEEEALEAAHIIARTEGIIIAPESSYTMAQLIKVSTMRKNKTILSCFTGSGLLDLPVLVGAQLPVTQMSAS